MYKVVFHRKVKRDISTIPAKNLDKIKKAIDTKLKSNPVFYGIPLRGTLNNYFKLRIGQYRIVFSVSISKKEVYILAISKRGNIYSKSAKRIK